MVAEFPTHKIDFSIPLNFAGMAFVVSRFIGNLFRLGMAFAQKIFNLALEPFQQSPGAIPLD